MKFMKIFKLFIVIAQIIYSSSFELSSSSATTSSTVSSSKTETEDKISNAINISEKFMKHRKIAMRLANKDKSTYKMVLPSDSAPVSGSSPEPSAAAPISGSSPKPSSPSQALPEASCAQPPKILPPRVQEQTEESLAQNLNEGDIGKGPIYFSGWLKYFKYTDQEGQVKSPQTFFKNMQYFQMQKKAQNLNFPNQVTSDINNKMLPLYPSNEFLFYALLYKDSLNFIEDRNNLQTVYDTFTVNGIAPVEDSPGFEASSENKNGIQDFGNFSEGFCLKILTRAPRNTWIICTESEGDKHRIMDTLKRLKIKEQIDRGVIIYPKNINVSPPTISNILGNSFLKSPNGDLTVKMGKGMDIIDGYWITLQDWTQCSLKCGGGTSTFQRMCVPPKSGGKNCEGSAILTKVCNTQPCPETKNSMFDGNKNTTIVLKPIVKVMPFSSRPQRYSKCVIKESDLMYTQTLENEVASENPIARSQLNDITHLQIPVRVVMNNKTFSFYKGEEFDTLVQTFDLKSTYLEKSIAHPICFMLRGNKKMAEFCPFGYNPKNTKMVEEWDYDFNLFKHQCKTQRETNELDNLLEEKLKEKIDAAKSDILTERRQEMKKKLAVEEESQKELLIKTTNTAALQAIQKEMSMEELVRKEEAEKERLELEEMRLKIEEEKKRSQCFMKAIKERELEDQRSLKAKQTEEEIAEIKKAATQQVTIRRNQLKNQILKMRKDAKRKKDQLAKELYSVRTSVAEQMAQISKKGDSSKCEKAIASENERKLYCESSFLDDFNAFQNCKDSEDFCNLCCDNEIGEIHANDRQICYKKICKPNSTAEKNDTQDGKWIWHDSVLGENKS